MIDIVILLLLAAILGGAAWYVYRAKKRGAACIGCPDAGSCKGSCGSCKGCACKE